MALAWVRVFTICWTIKLCTHTAQQGTAEFSTLRMGQDCIGCLCRLGDAEGAEAAFEHARGSGVWILADTTTVNYLLNALSRDSEKAFER